MRPLYHGIVMATLMNVLIPSAVNAQSKTGQRTAVSAQAGEFAATDKKTGELPAEAASTTDGIAGWISGNFTRDIDKARAAYFWVASNLKYDIANMFALNFHERRADKVVKALATRKGVCEHYAALFAEICTKAGLKAFVVEGFTKQNGFVDYIPHAWCAVRTDGEWHLYDPTWGSGYVANGKFVKKISNNYFKVAPEKIVKTHMPFDYLWQCLEYPVTSSEFIEGKMPARNGKQPFAYKDSIAVFETQQEMEYYAAAVKRIEQNGLRNSMQFDRLQQLKMALETDRQNKHVEAQNRKSEIFNNAASKFNRAIYYFNEFIDYRNKQFKPEKPDADIQAMLDAAANKIKETDSLLASINQPEASLATMVQDLQQKTPDIGKRINEQQEWLRKYFSKGKAGRKSMFTKYTWFGIPLN
ncbi:transglutaminase domain-containing protein [Chitinophaga pollutisoli]|uniref:Transglutaminase domain-containing protein n=1 Tax=Chitinophaga pollutisoli TaxID=3133966 RepID=A0ABZ2YRI4_9BACT